MLQNAYLLAKIGADTAENERNFAPKNCPKIGKYPPTRCAPRGPAAEPPAHGPRRHPRGPDDHGAVLQALRPRGRAALAIFFWDPGGQLWQILKGSFSALLKPIFCKKNLKFRFVALFNLFKSSARLHRSKLNMLTEFWIENLRCCWNDSIFL